MITRRAKENTQRQNLNAISAIAISRDGNYIAAVIGVSTSEARVVVTQTERKEVVLELGGEAEGSNTEGAYYCVAFQPTLRERKPLVDFGV